MLALDGYIARARFIPALIAMMPLFLFSVIGLFSLSFPWPNGVPAVAAGALFFVLSDLARRMGRRVEHQIHEPFGGKITGSLLRRDNKTFDQITKDRYKAFLASKIGEIPPIEENANLDSEICMEFYSRCANWLRENTRDGSRFKLLLEENITYGFRRNLYGLKPIAISLDITLLFLLAYLFFREAAQFTSLLLVFGASVLHIFYFICFVTKSAVLEASDQYARQLFLSCEQLMNE